MARGVVLNPGGENAPGWAPAMTSPAAGAGGAGGGAGQVREPPLGDGWRRGRPGCRQDGARTRWSRETQAAPSLAAPSSTSCPAEESWWSGLVIVIAVCCASLLFLAVLVIICYKAIKR